MRKQNPYALAIIGLMMMIFGVIDTLFMNKIVGILLIIAGLGVGYVGLDQAKKMKEAAAQAKKKRV